MVRRGSTVRVRQRALQKRRKPTLLFRENLHDLQRAVGMEPFMEPSGSERGLKASEMVAFAGNRRDGGDRTHGREHALPGHGAGRQLG
jgi:hypothetical protein